uniref:Uncharacterized protein n=1 Tax=Arundo donax TaxID=35708 RepID=A0A0A9RV19_ARUDO
MIDAQKPPNTKKNQLLKMRKSASRNRLETPEDDYSLPRRPVTRRMMFLLGAIQMLDKMCISTTSHHGHFGIELSFLKPHRALFCAATSSSYLCYRKEIEMLDAEVREYWR